MDSDQGFLTNGNVMIMMDIVNSMDKIIVMRTEIVMKTLVKLPMKHVVYVEVVSLTT